MGDDDPDAWIERDGHWVGPLSPSVYVPTAGGSFRTVAGSRLVADRPPRDERGIVGFVFRTYKRVTGGADGAVGLGLNGSLTAGNAEWVLRAMGVGRSVFVDVGASEGRMLLAACVLGASRAVGYELPDSGPTNRRICEAVRDALRIPAARVEYRIEDIADVETLPRGTECVYCFWTGFRACDQRHVMRLVERCATVRSVGVFAHRGRWDEASVREALGPRWRDASAEIRAVTMFGSGEQKTVIVLRR